MLTLAATLSLTLSTGGLLTGAMPAGVHLLEDLTLAQLPEHATPQLLQQQISELEDSLPGIGGPIAMVVVGGVAVLGGAFVAYIGLLFALLGGGTATFLLVGGIAAIIGIPLIIVGAILLAKSLRERRAVSREVQQLKRQLRVLEQGGSPRQDLGLPPPPPPPQVEGPHPSLLLATF